MTNLARYQNSLQILVRLYKIIGQDIFAKSNYRHGILYYLMVLLLLAAISFYALDLVFTNDLPKLIRVGQGAILLGAIQVICKYISLADLLMLRPIIDYFETFYRANSRPNDKYYAIGERYARITEHGLKIALIAFTGLLLATLVLSLYDTYRTGTPMLFLYFPFVHAYSSVQFLALNAFIGVIHVVTAIAEPAGDAFIFVIVVSLTMIPMVIEQHMEELSAKLEQGMATVAQIKQRLLYYIVMHQRFNR